MDTIDTIRAQNDAHAREATVSAPIAAGANGAGPDPAAVAEREFPTTELALAERFASDHAGDVLHVAGRGWHAFDGRRYRPDEAGVHNRAKATVRAVHHEAVDFGGGEAERKARIRCAECAELAQGIRAMLELAETEEGVHRERAELDADPMLLNVANGTIDLRTGDLREHRRADLMTRLADVDFDPDAESRDWERFLIGATEADFTATSFLARLAGYSLTGDIREEKLFFVHGPGATGKSTFIDMLKAVMGDYATTADFETFTKRRGDRGVPADIARLDGARLVSSQEVDEGKALAEGAREAAHRRRHGDGARPLPGLLRVQARDEAVARGQRGPARRRRRHGHVAQDRPGTVPPRRA